VTAPLGTLEERVIRNSVRRHTVRVEHPRTRRDAHIDRPGTPTITSSAPPQAIVGTPYTYTIYTTGFPAPAITEVGPCPLVSLSRTMATARPRSLEPPPERALVIR